MSPSAWWPAVPPGTPRREADRLTALACAVRVTGTGSADQGITSRANRAETIAEHLADWLAEVPADDGQAAVRRQVLILTCELAVPGDTSSYSPIRRPYTRKRRRRAC